MAVRSKKRGDIADARERMRLFIAAAAVFVLLIGLSVLIFLILFRDKEPAAVLPVFLPFFLVGLLFFGASAFIDVGMVRQFTSYFSPGARGQND